MRLLHVYAGNLYGGIERMLGTIARTPSPGLTSEFALCFQGRLSEELQQAGATLHDLGQVRLRRPWSVLRARRRLSRLLRSVDVVACHGTWALALFGPTIRRAGRPLIGWMHDRMTGVTYIDRLARRVRLNLLLVNSQYTADSVGLFWPGTRVEVLAPPVEAPPSADRAEVRRELNLPQGTVAIVHAARLERLKGAGVLLEAARLLRDDPPWRLILVGGAQRPAEQIYLSELHRKALQIPRPERVDFLGQRQDVPRLLAGADLLVQPNIGPDAFGLIFVEAMAAGVPVVTTRLGGAPEVVPSTCGILLEDTQPETVARVVQSLIDDPDHRQRLSQAGPNHANKLCDPTQQKERLFAIFENMVPQERVYR